MASPRLAYVVGNAAFFVSHRLPLALSAICAGYLVRLFAGQPGSRKMDMTAEKILMEQEIDWERVSFRGGSLNPVVELLGLLQLLLRLKSFKPNLVHCVSLKGFLYGGICARVLRVHSLVVSISGLGFAFTTSEKNELSRSIARCVVRAAARYIFSHPNIHVIVQNQDDQKEILSFASLQKKKITVIPGSGIDLDCFVNCSVNTKKNIVLFPARLLRDKGVYEFVDVARSLRGRLTEWQFVIAGAAGYDNPSSVPEKVARAWHLNRDVIWVGHVDYEEMIKLFHDAAIVCLPSYREGMPKSLLEAAAAGCAVVTTDAVGCRDSILPGVTGELVPVGDRFTLEAVLSSLMQNQMLRERYGRNGQRLAQERFSVEKVKDATLAVYRVAMEGRNE
jgi:glycosyltransferase involved in cell wall biosynthesis